MFMIILMFIAALAISAVSAWFSIAGIMAIFAGASIAALIMGIVLEVGKLVATSWLYRNWSHAPLLLRVPMVISTIILMFITSMGAYGFLSKAHIQQGANTENNTIKLERLEQQIAVEQSHITDSNKVIAQLDAAVDNYTANDRVKLSVLLRREQASQRKQLNDDIRDSQKVIDQLTDQQFELKSQNKHAELEVGPVKYIAALIYNDAANNLESTVRIVILIIVAVFDPFAVLLLLAANYSLMRHKAVPRVNPITDEPVTNSVHANSAAYTPAVSTVTPRTEENDILNSRIFVPKRTDNETQYVSPRWNRPNETDVANKADPVIIEEQQSVIISDNSPDATLEIHASGEMLGNYFNKHTGFVFKPPIDTDESKKPPTILGWIDLDKRR